MDKNSGRVAFLDLIKRPPSDNAGDHQPLQAGKKGGVERFADLSHIDDSDMVEKILTSC